MTKRRTFNAQRRKLRDRRAGQSSYVRYGKREHTYPSTELMIEHCRAAFPPIRRDGAIVRGCRL